MSYKTRTSAERKRANTSPPAGTSKERGGEKKKITSTTTAWGGFKSRLASPRKKEGERKTKKRTPGEEFKPCSAKGAPHLDYRQWKWEKHSSTSVFGQARKRVKRDITNRFKNGREWVRR